MTDYQGLRLSIYTHKDGEWGDCTNGGVTSRPGVFYLTLVGTAKHGEDMKPLPRHSQVFAPDSKAPAVVLVESNVPHLYGPHLEPLDHFEAGRWTMCGGNYAGTSDSRWAELGEKVFGRDRLSAVSVHDRVEG